MPPIVRTAAIGVAFATLIALYATRLQFAPPALMHDESKFALQAQAIAATGRDLSGRRLPLYFTEPEFPAGRDPVIIYATALVLTVLPLSESSVRLATSLVGVINVCLMFGVGRSLFKSNTLGLVAAILLALTPAHFIRSRMVLSPLYSIPFILAWLLWLSKFVDRPERRTLAIAAAWLGVGLYTYLGCAVMMPVYVALTAAIAFRQRLAGWPSSLAAGFLVPLVPMAAWSLTHPDRYAQIIEAYRLYSADATPLEGAAGFAAYDSIRLRLGLYWSFFSPEFLFMTGDTSLVNSTRQVGFFPLAFAVLIPVGMFTLARRAGDLGKVILAGWLTAPMASVVSGAIEMNRIMFAIPFGVLVAAFGVKTLLDSKAAVSRAIAAVLLAGCAWQFAGFYTDYTGRYRAASSEWFGGDIRAALTEAIARGGDTRIYLSRGIPFIDRYWRFYAIALNRSDLLGREMLFEWPAIDLHSVPGGSVMVCRTNEPVCAAALADAEWSLARSIFEPGGGTLFAVFEKR
jgi:4-amino-4-deoxy-L-arabinose transferase-like glycosyltransferase